MVLLIPATVPKYIHLILEQDISTRALRTLFLESPQQATFHVPTSHLFRRTETNPQAHWLPPCREHLAHKALSVRPAWIKYPSLAMTTILTTVALTLVTLEVPLDRTCDRVGCFGQTKTTTRSSAICSLTILDFDAKTDHAITHSSRSMPVLEGLTQILTLGGLLKMRGIKGRS